MQRNYLAALIAGLTILALLLVGATAGLGTVGADSTDAQNANQTISVSATGDAEAAPDQAVVRVAVTAEGDDTGQISDELAAGADELRAALDELGVEYETTDYSIREHHDRPTYEGYHGFSVTVEDIEAIGSVIDAGADAGAEVSNVQLTLSDETRTELRDDAIDAAMADARHQAETIAATSNIAVSGVLTVDASQQHFRPVSFDAVAESGDGASTPTQVEAGDVSVTYNVQVTYNATS